MLAGHMHPEFSQVRRSADESPRAASPAAPCDCELDSECLLQGQREVLIRHGAECYRLRHTRNGKLILTK